MSFVAALRTNFVLVIPELVKAIGEFRKFTDQPLTLRGGNYAHAVQELNTSIDRTNKLLQ